MSNLNVPDFASNGLTIIIHGGGGDGSGLLGWLDNLLATLSGLIETGKSFEFFPGIAALGGNIHPLIVHFPIAFLIGFFVVDLLGASLRRPALRPVASGMLYFGTIGAVAASITGLIAEATVPHGEAVHDMMEWHGRIGLTIATLSVLLTLWRIFARKPRSPMANGLYWLMNGVLVLLTLIGADLGGLMVYQHGVAVKSLQTPDSHHHDVAAPHAVP